MNKFKMQSWEFWNSENEKARQGAQKAKSRQALRKWNARMMECRMALRELEREMKNNKS